MPERKVWGSPEIESDVRFRCVQTFSAAPHRGAVVELLSNPAQAALAERYRIPC